MLRRKISWVYKKFDESTNSILQTSTGNKQKIVEVIGSDTYVQIFKEIDVMHITVSQHNSCSKQHKTKMNWNCLISLHDPSPE